MHLICHIFRLIPFQSAAKSKISSAWCQRAVDLVLFHCMRSPYACRIAGRLTYTTSSQCGSLIWHAHHTPYTVQVQFLNEAAQRWNVVHTKNRYGNWLTASALSAVWHVQFPSLHMHRTVGTFVLLTLICISTVLTDCHHNHSLGHNQNKFDYGSGVWWLLYGAGVAFNNAKHTD